MLCFYFRKLLSHNQPCITYCAAMCLVSKSALLLVNADRQPHSGVTHSFKMRCFLYWEPSSASFSAGKLQRWGCRAVERGSYPFGWWQARPSLRCRFCVHLCSPLWPWKVEDPFIEKGKVTYCPRPAACVGAGFKLTVLAHHVLPLSLTPCPRVGVGIISGAYFCQFHSCDLVCLGVSVSEQMSRCSQWLWGLCALELTGQGEASPLFL